MVLLCTFNIENDDEAMDFEVCRDMPILMPYFQTNPLLYYPMTGGSGPELTSMLDTCVSFATHLEKLTSFQHI